MSWKVDYQQIYFQKNQLKSRGGQRCISLFNSADRPHSPSAIPLLDNFVSLKLLINCPVLINALTSTVQSIFHMNTRLKWIWTRIERTIQNTVFVHCALSSNARSLELQLPKSSCGHRPLRALRYYHRGGLFWSNWLTESEGLTAKYVAWVSRGFCRRGCLIVLATASCPFRLHLNVCLSVFLQRIPTSSHISSTAADHSPTDS